VSFWERLSTIDRRWVFLTLAVGVIVPMIAPLKLPIAVTPEVKSVFDRIDAMKPGDVIHLDAGYDPSTRAEMEPMTYAILRHAYSKDLKVICTCLSVQGVSLVEQELAALAEENGKAYGEDYVYLGYKPYPAIVMLAMGEDYRQPFPFDYYKNETDKLPMMKGVRNYDDVELVITVSATSGVDMWIQYGVGRYQFPLAIAVTAVMATDYYAFLQSKQIVGLIGGMKGAAEYERLIAQEGYATRVMNIQSVVHLLIVAFIVVGNLAFLMSGGRIRMGGRA
jgi:hypothetical protein